MCIAENSFFDRMSIKSIGSRFPSSVPKVEQSTVFIVHLSIEIAS